MQNLLNDPTFYKLLIDNNESLIADDLPVGLSGKDSIPQDTNHVRQEEFNFLKKLTFPTMSRTPLHTQPSVSSDTSYQSSIFSNANHNDLKANDLLDAANTVNLLEDFYSKEVKLQLDSEIHPTRTLKTPSSSSSSRTTAPDSGASTFHEFQSQFPIIKTEQIQSKHFHKFYTSSVPPSTPSLPKTAGPIKQSSSDSQLQQQTNSKITKPSCPSSSTIHICPFCQRQFKNKPYLARHIKKHDTVKEFKCPFFNETESKCHHLNGEFSRRDTFKAHLKSIHFIYPVGVFKSDRNSSSGRCAGCFKEFNSNNEWVNNHIETGECPVLVQTTKTE